MKNYQTINGTSYDERTPDQVVAVLESARRDRTRLHISLGDTESGKDWLEEFEAHGYVGRSTGRIKVPLLLAGGLGGSLETGRVLDYIGKGDDNRKLCSLYLSLLDRMGVSQKRFGDAEQRLAAL